MSTCSFIAAPAPPMVAKRTRKTVKPPSNVLPRANGCTGLAACNGMACGVLRSCLSWFFLSSHWIDHPRFQLAKATGSNPSIAGRTFTSLLATCPPEWIRCDNLRLLLFGVVFYHNTQSSLVKEPGGQFRASVRQNETDRHTSKSLALIRWLIPADRCKGLHTTTMIFVLIGLTASPP